MNIRAAILKEYSKTNALRIAAYACSSPKAFSELMACFMDEEYRLAQRAAWSVSFAAEQNPALLQPYIKDLVHRIQQPDVHPAVIRNSVRILEKIEIPAQFHGPVMNTCFQFIATPTTPVAIKAFSLTVLFNLSHDYPEIKPELKLIIEERWQYESAAFKSRAKKILKSQELEKENTQV